MNLLENPARWLFTFAHSGVVLHEWGVLLAYAANARNPDEALRGRLKHGSAFLNMPHYLRGNSDTVA